MRFSTVAASAAFVAGVSAGYSNVSYVTEIVDTYVTYCPEATSVVHGNQTYTVTEATTLTITNCPCTVTKPVYTTSAVYCPTCLGSSGAPIPVSTSVAAPLPASSAPAAPSYFNSTGPAAPTVASSGSAASTGAPSASAPAAAAPTTFHGAADKAFAASGAGLAGLLALAAYIL